MGSLRDALSHKIVNGDMMMISQRSIACFGLGREVRRFGQIHDTTSGVAVGDGLTDWPPPQLCFR